MPAITNIIKAIQLFRLGSGEANIKTGNISNILEIVMQLAIKTICVVDCKLSLQ